MKEASNPVKLEGRASPTTRYPVKLEGRASPTTRYPVKLEASFEEVDFRELKVGVKYKFKDLPERYSYYTGIFKKHNGRLQEFEHVMYHGPFQSYKQSELYYVDKFYYVLISQKEKIQQAMESRALHTILRGLLDPHFTWE